MPTAEDDRAFTHHSVFHSVEPLAPEVEQRRDLKRRLVDETRRLVEEVALLDAAEAPDADLRKLTERVAALAGEVAGAPSLRKHGGLTSSPGFAGALDERSPVCGQSNPLAAPLRMWADGELTRGEAVYGAAYEGPTYSVHGGVVAGAFDELLGVAQVASGNAGMTGTLTIRLRQPTPLGRKIDYEAGFDRMEGRKIFAWGRSYADGDLLVEAEGIFIVPKQGTALGDRELSS
jgi:acyl-coenzyme A thioesterase PaaI-like protein